MQTLLKIIEIIMLVFCGYTLWVLFIEIKDSLSSREAIEHVNSKLKNLIHGFIKGVKNSFEEEKVVENYNIFIGFDSSGNAIASSIDCIFADLVKVYENYVFCGCKLETNRLVYRFKVSQPIINIKDEQLYSYCTSLCDSIVQKEIQRRNPLYLYMYNLVGILISADFLDVYVAQNYKGQQENVMMTELVRRQFKMSDFPQNDSIETKWEE